MGFWDWLGGNDGCDNDEDEVSSHEEYLAERRSEDPDYDLKRQTNLTNFKLRERRDLLAQQEQNIALALEIAELEQRAQARKEGREP